MCAHLPCVVAFSVASLRGISFCDWVLWAGIDFDVVRVFGVGRLRQDVRV